MLPAAMVPSAGVEAILQALRRWPLPGDIIGQETAMTRRTFLEAGALSTAAAAQSAPPARPVGPNSRITVGMIAVGARAHELLEAIKQN